MGQDFPLSGRVVSLKRRKDHLVSGLGQGRAIPRAVALRPEKYRERVEVRSTLASIDLNRLTDEQLARITGTDAEVPECCGAPR